MPDAVYAVIIVVTIVGVAVVLLSRPFVDQFANPTQTWLVLAMAATFAGNLTLLGSVANLVVAELAGRQGVALTCAGYLKAGVSITLLTIVLGVFWLSFQFAA